LNQASSRSHCIFTVALEGKHANSDTYFVSKLHLVDLAGSERISKSQVEGSILVEAKHINLSLSYLEQVIIALHEKGLGNRSHIPYRNSLMTTILKDSLGGNCKTVMVATLSSDIESLEETVSTARFAQRCSQLVNEIKKNEKIDLNMLVKKLEYENVQLQQELEYYKLHFGDKSIYPKDGNASAKKGITNKGNIEERKLSQFEYFEINANVEAYLNEKVDKLTVKDVSESQAYFRAMKDVYHSRMREYITELNAISLKLRKYEDILSKKKGNKSLTEFEDMSPFSKAYKELSNGAKEEIKQNASNGFSGYVNQGNNDGENMNNNLPQRYPQRNYEQVTEKNGMANKKVNYDIKKKSQTILAKLGTDQPIPETSEAYE